MVSASIFLFWQEHRLDQMVDMKGFSRFYDIAAAKTKVMIYEFYFGVFTGLSIFMLINDILDMSKIEAGKIKILPVSFRLHNLLNELGEMFRFRIEKKNLRFKLEFHSDLPDLIKADDNRLRQIIINLLGNAVKFTEEGEITLKCGKINNLIQIMVSDTGCGIPPGLL